MSIFTEVDRSSQALALIVLLVCYTVQSSGGFVPSLTVVAVNPRHSNMASSSRVRTLCIIAIILAFQSAVRGTCACNVGEGDGGKGEWRGGRRTVSRRACACPTWQCGQVGKKDLEGSSVGKIHPLVCMMHCQAPLCNAQCALRRQIAVTDRARVIMCFPHCVCTTAQVGGHVSWRRAAAAAAAAAVAVAAVVTAAITAVFLAACSTA